MIKGEFKEAVNKITDEKLKIAANKMIDNVPDYFWIAPASSTGKYHPKCSLGDGGLARHSYMVMTTALDLLRAEIFCSDIELNRDMAIIASLFHDCMKYGAGNIYTPSSHTLFDHPLLAAKFIERHLVECLDDNTISNGVILTIVSAVKSHMGKWTTSDRSNAILPRPITDFDKLIHTADYMASRKYCDYYQIIEE